MRSSFSHRETDLVTGTVTPLKSDRLEMDLQKKGGRKRSRGAIQNQVDRTKVLATVWHGLRRNFRTHGQANNSPNAANDRRSKRKVGKTPRHQVRLPLRGPR